MQIPLHIIYNPILITTTNPKKIPRNSYNSPRNFIYNPILITTTTENKMPKYRKKLIEVDLPLTDISSDSYVERYQRHGHPSRVHLWWARRPLASCRAVIFASMVDDPESYIDDPEEQIAERARLHGIISRLVEWKNSNNPELLAEARLEIARSIARQLGNGDLPSVGAPPPPASK